jgi:hypothetical protein
MGRTSYTPVKCSQKSCWHTCWGWELLKSKVMSLVSSSCCRYSNTAIWGTFHCTRQLHCSSKALHKLMMSDVWDGWQCYSEIIWLKISLFIHIYITFGAMNFELQNPSSVTLLSELGYVVDIHGFLHFVLSHFYRWPWLQDEVHWLLEGESQIIFDHIWWARPF